jgi:hypothetical protein
MGTSRKDAQRVQAIIARRRWRLTSPFKLGECVRTVPHACEGAVCQSGNAHGEISHQDLRATRIFPCDGQG